MRLGRRDATTTEVAAGEPVPVEAEPEGKGRPTPKRAEARKARRGATPRNRKEAGAAQRERARLERQRARQALITGDERFLPPRDAGPERRLARDVVDSRFTYGQIFVVVVVVVFFLGGFVPYNAVRAVANLAGLASLVIITFDSARHARAAQRLVTERYGAARARGITSYAFLRAMLPRRFRRPPPKVGRGAAV